MDRLGLDPPRESRHRIVNREHPFQVLLPGPETGLDRDSQLR